ncbi:cysteine hydrolase family protein [Sulfurimonas sp.]
MLKKRALLIIDMQNDFVLPTAPQAVAGAIDIICNIQILLHSFREKNLPVFHIIREYRADGSDIEHTRRSDFLIRSYCVPNTNGAKIISELTPLDNEYIIVKNRFSGFMQTELDFILRQLNVQELVICGIQYPNCIRATVFDGVSLGYDVTLIADATGAQSEEWLNQIFLI